MKVYYRTAWYTSLNMLLNSLVHLKLFSLVTQTQKSSSRSIIFLLGFWAFSKNIITLLCSSKIGISSRMRQWSLAAGFTVSSGLVSFARSKFSSRLKKKINSKPFEKY
jgi:hypothetical protein